MGISYMWWDSSTKPSTIFKGPLQSFPLLVTTREALLKRSPRFGLLKDEIRMKPPNLLTRVEQANKNPKKTDRIYVSRHTLLFPAAIARLSRRVVRRSSAVRRFSEDRHGYKRDSVLAAMTLLSRAEIFSRGPARLKIVSERYSKLRRSFRPCPPPQLHGHYERLLGVALSSSGRSAASHAHFDRASRLFTSISSSPDLANLQRSRAAANARCPTRMPIQSRLGL